MASSHDSTQAASPFPREASERFERLRSSFGAAYAVALAGSLASAGLTYVYVGGNVARELNPVIRLVIDSLGVGGMVGVKVVVLVAGFWGFYWLSRSVARPATAAGFAWVASVVHLADALHDLRVAGVAGVPEGVDLLVPSVLVALGLLVGVLFRPPRRL